MKRPDTASPGMEMPGMEMPVFQAAAFPGSITVTSEAEMAARRSLKAQRERVLNILLASGAVLGLVGYVPAILKIIATHQIGPGLGYTLAYAWLICIAFIRRIPYTVRSGSLLVIIYSLGLLNVFQSGLSGDSGVFLLSFAIMTSLFLGLKSGLVAAAIGAATMGVGGWLISTGWIRVPPLLTDPKNLIDWLSGTAILLALDIAAILSITDLVRGLESSLKQSRRLAEELIQERAQLHQRTEILERREGQIRAAAEISRTISAVLDQDLLLQEVVDLIQNRFNLYYVAVFLLPSQASSMTLHSEENEPGRFTGEYAYLRAATGEAGKMMIASGHKLAVGGESMIGWAVLNRKARIAQNIDLDTVQFKNPLLPETRSELALPLLNREKVLGAVSIQSTQEGAFDEEDITILQTLADALAVALENARLFQAVQANLKEISTLNRQYVSRSWSELGKQDENLGYVYANDPSSVTVLEGDGPTRLNIPLTLRDETIGNLALDKENLSLSKEEQTFVEAVLTQAALALENARLIEASQRRAAMERATTHISSKLWASTSVDQILRTALEELGHTLGVSGGLIELSVAPTMEKDE